MTEPTRFDSMGSPRYDHQDRELVFTTESPGITAAEIAHQRQAEDRAAAVQRIMAKRVDDNRE